MHWTLHLVLQSSTRSSPLSFLPSLASPGQRVLLYWQCMNSCIIFPTNVLQPNVEKLGYEKVICLLYNDRISNLRIYTLHNICHVCLYSLGHACAVVKKIHCIMICCKWLITYGNKTHSRCCLPHKKEYEHHPNIDKFGYGWLIINCRIIKICLFCWQCHQVLSTMDQYLVRYWLRTVRQHAYYLST